MFSSRHRCSSLPAWGSRSNPTPTPQHAELGRELSVPRHLQDDEEFQMPLAGAARARRAAVRRELDASRKAAAVRSPRAPASSSPIRVAPLVGMSRVQSRLGTRRELVRRLSQRAVRHRRRRRRLRHQRLRARAALRLRHVRSRRHDADARRRRRRRASRCRSQTVGNLRATTGHVRRRLPRDAGAPDDGRPAGDPRSASTLGADGGAGEPRASRSAR